MLVAYGSIIRNCRVNIWSVFLQIVILVWYSGGMGVCDVQLRMRAGCEIGALNFGWCAMESLVDYHSNIRDQWNLRRFWEIRRKPLHFWLARTPKIWQHVFLQRHTKLHCRHYSVSKNGITRNVTHKINPPDTLSRPIFSVRIASTKWASNFQTWKVLLKIFIVDFSWEWINHQIYMMTFWIIWGELVW